MSRLLKWVVMIAIGLGIFFGMRYWRSSSTSGEVRDQMLEVIRTTECHAADPTYVEQVFSKAHEEAFAAAYKAGGRRKRAEFDSDLYAQKLLAAMAEKARADGRNECFVEFVAMRAMVGSE